MAEIAGFVLAGGRSSRMGSDKSFLEIDGETLLQRAMRVLRSVTDDVSIVGSAEKFGGLAPVLEDVYPECGPLGGIHAALSATRAERNLVVAVDLPFVSPELLRFLLDRARECHAVVTVPRVAGRYQPLCAVYRLGFCGIAAEALARQANKIDALFAKVPLRVLEEGELRRFAFPPAMFDNLNTPADLERARQSRR